MYKTTTTTPEIQLTTTNTYDSGTTLRATVMARHRSTPEKIQEYLKDMGWSAYSASDGDWMFSHQDVGFGNYMTWEQAVTYCLIKPFLEENK